MARPIAILKALATAYRRDWTALKSLTGNNFFLITAFLLRQAGAFVYLIVGLVLLFPLSTDPLRKIPPSRLALWPLTRREHWVLRLAGRSPPVCGVWWQRCSWRRSRFPTCRLRAARRCGGGLPDFPVRSINSFG